MIKDVRLCEIIGLSLVNILAGMILTVLNAVLVGWEFTLYGWGSPARPVVIAWYYLGAAILILAVEVVASLFLMVIEEDD